mmetsp:Transcript_5764/g.11535  ORF Transcript_5764/g.11535 Transcript_5764/m.11535 type:complete len:290 (+) Transcript_5764:97-966(+)
MTPQRLTIATLIALGASLPTASSFSALSANQSHARLSSSSTSSSLSSLFSRRPAESTSHLSLKNRSNHDEPNANVNAPAPLRLRQQLSAPLVTLAVLSAVLLSPLHGDGAAFAYDESDYASETVTNVVQRLKDTAGDDQGTFATLEEIAAIIREGKGVGGSLSYSGVRLNEGYVADEDTNIYNPGLTLLTQSEKERLVASLIQNRQTGLSTNHWTENNEYAFDFLKQKLDPLHMYELSGYLGILPYWGAILYLGALFAQQNARGIFPLVYGLCALGVFGPVLLLVANAP